MRILFIGDTIVKATAGLRVRKHIFAFCFAFGLLAISPSSARTVVVPSVDEAYRSADIIVTVYMIHSGQHFVDKEKCGTQYTAVVGRVLKGPKTLSHTSIRFGGGSPLVLHKAYLIFLKKYSDPMPLYDRAVQDFILETGHAATIPKAKLLSLIACNGLVPGYRFDGDLAWPYTKGEVLVSGLWRRSAVPKSIHMLPYQTPYNLMRADDLFAYLEKLNERSR